MESFQSTHPIRDATLAAIHIGDNVEQFQSTHPIRDATSRIPWTSPARIYFNPRIPYGMRRHLVCGGGMVCDISIHASHTGCDLEQHGVAGEVAQFQSTHPIRDATSSVIQSPWSFANFNPRIPYGMRPLPAVVAPRAGLFQSTHPIRDATLKQSSKFSHKI